MSVKIFSIKTPMLEGSIGVSGVMISGIVRFYFISSRVGENPKPDRLRQCESRARWTIGIARKLNA